MPTEDRRGRERSGPCGLLITQIRIDGECSVCTNDVFSHNRLWCACIAVLLNCVSMSLYTTMSRCGVCTAVNDIVPLAVRRTHLVLHYIYIVFTTSGRKPHEPHSLEPKLRVSWL
jgi:hypothetical protein